MELAALRNRETAFRTALVDAVDEGVAIVAADGTVHDINPAFADITG